MANENVTFVDVLGHTDTLSGIPELTEPDFKSITDIDQLKGAIDSYIQSESARTNSILNAESGTNAAELQNVADSVSAQHSQLQTEQSQVDQTVQNLQNYEDSLVAYRQELIDEAGGVLYTFDNTADPLPDTSSTPAPAATPAPAGVSVAALAASYLLF